MLISLFDKLDAFDATPAHLGGKGHGLWWMQSQGIPVPPALIIPTSVCVSYMHSPTKTKMEIRDQLPEIRKYFTEKFGFMPLLSVRSGARVSMPGMMDTILNVGLDSKTYPEWVERLGEHCAADSYKRLLVMFGNVVNNVERRKLECESVEDTFKAWSAATGNPGWLTTDEQILQAVVAVFDSWNNERAKVYRQIHQIPEEWGTACVLQAMVFGNLNDNSGTGVLFTRNPDTGERVITGDFLANAQGEDVVAGIVTPSDLHKDKQVTNEKTGKTEVVPSMASWNHGVYQQLLQTASTMEKLKSDVQDIEFTVQDGQLYILQTRNAKRSARAAVRIALEMHAEKMIGRQEAIKRVSQRTLDMADQPVIDPKFKDTPDYTGIPACSGVVSGVVALSSAEAVSMAALGQKVVMVTKETTPEDIKGMLAAVGILTMTGGSTSHAAVVARSFNRCCIVGLGESHDKFKSGDKISLDGNTGRIWMQEVPVISGQSADVESFRQLVVGDASLLVDRPPKYRAKTICLDLTNRLPEQDTLLINEILDTAKICEKLQVMVAEPTPEQREILTVFYTDSQLDDRLKAVRALVDQLNTPLTAVGWASSKHSAINCVPASSLADLTLLSSNGLLAQGTLTGKEKKAYEKIIQWLAKDGVTLTLLNQKGGTASWTVHAG